jgi:hypothetical protein
MKTPETCPVCGADVPAHARACPECGACEDTGWSEDAYASNLGLPDADFDYEDFVEREFGTSRQRRPRGIGRLWWWVAVLLLLGFVLWFLMARFLSR